MRPTVAEQLYSEILIRTIRGSEKYEVLIMKEKEEEVVPVDTDSLTRDPATGIKDGEQEREQLAESMALKHRYIQLGNRNGVGNHRYDVVWFKMKHCPTIESSVLKVIACATNNVSLQYGLLYLLMPSIAAAASISEQILADCTEPIVVNELITRTTLAYAHLEEQDYEIFAEKGIVAEVKRRQLRRYGMHTTADVDGIAHEAIKTAWLHYDKIAKTTDNTEKLFALCVNFASGINEEAIWRRRMDAVKAAPAMQSPPAANGPPALAS